MNFDNEAIREQYLKQIKKLAFSTFQQALSKHGFKLYASNSFIAEGGFGTVLRIHKSGQKYACKVISNVMFRLKSDKSHFTTVKMRSRFSNEVEIMKRVCCHPNIVTYITSFNEDLVKKLKTGASMGTQKLDGETWSEEEEFEFKNCFIVMEYANAKTLSFYIKNRRRLSEDVVKTIFREVNNAVQYMHNQQIVHRDIKLSNLLLQRSNCSRLNTTSTKFNFTVKLCDFGLSSIVDKDDGLFMKPVGTAFYMAPEILRAYYFYNKRQVEMIAPYCAYKGDIWALGVCIFFCLHGFYPLEIVCHSSKHERLAELEKIFELGVKHVDEQETNKCFNNNFQQIIRNYHYKLSCNGKDLLARMLEIVPEKRINIHAVMEHDYFW